MRIRAFKSGNPFVALFKRKSNQRFAWKWKRLDNGTVVWLEWYTKRPKYEYGRYQK